MNNLQQKWVETVEQFLSDAQQCPVQPAEIELRLGSATFCQDNNHFCVTVSKSQSEFEVWPSRHNFLPGIQQDQFARLMQTLLQNKLNDFTRRVESETDLVVHYGDGSRCIRSANGCVLHQKKQRIAQWNALYNCGVQKDMVFATRLSLSGEETLPNEVQKIGNHNKKILFFRARSRSSFYHKMWRIDLTEVRQASNVTDLIDAMPSYEVECELLPNVDWQATSPKYVALTLFLLVDQLLKIMKHNGENADKMQQTLILQPKAAKLDMFDPPLLA